ncbi:MAG: hypothetical protein KAX15_04200, partial [Candidatus Omnitrophica bacterium]|nr:hypothetical protein [Candidatus Omnitrophota bacterium]
YQVFTHLDKGDINGNIIYVKADEEVEGDTGHVTIRSTTKNLKFSAFCIAAEGGFLIEGGKNIFLTPQGDYPLLITKTGKIIEQGSGGPADRPLEGILCTEGDLEFDNISLQGAVIAGSVTINNSVVIKYKSNKIPDDPPYIMGTSTVLKWRETY